MIYLTSVSRAREASTHQGMKIAMNALGHFTHVTNVWMLHHHEWMWSFIRTFHRTVRDTLLNSNDQCVVSLLLFSTTDWCLGRLECNTPCSVKVICTQNKSTLTCLTYVTSLKSEAKCIVVNLFPCLEAGSVKVPNFSGTSSNKWNRRLKASDKMQIRPSLIYYKSVVSRGQAKPR